MARKATKAGEAIERERLGSLGEHLQQGLLARSEREQGTDFIGCFAPKCHLHGCGHDIFIGDTDESTELAVIEPSTYGGTFYRIDLSNDNVMSLFTVNAHAALYGRGAIEGGSSLNHINLFIATYASYLTIVLHANEQTAPVGIGKCREGARNLACIGDFILEILLLVFAFSD